jgi:hypothetical protein
VSIKVCGSAFRLAFGDGVLKKDAADLLKGSGIHHSLDEGSVVRVCDSAYVEDRRRFIVASRREEIGTGPAIAVRHRDAVSGEQSAADLSILTITAEKERR